MSKVKEWFFNISKNIKEMFVRFPLTIGVILIVTTIFSICVEQTWVNDDFYVNAIVFGGIFASSTMFTENYFSKWQYRIITYLIEAVIAAIFTLTINPNEKLTTISAIAIRIAAGYTIILILLSIYKILKKSKYKFEEYVLKVFANLFMSSITYVILNIGITLVSLIFIELILNGDGGEFILRIQIMLFGYFFINSLLFSISNIGEKSVNTFIKSLVIYVGVPLITIAMAIIYIYIMKIIILRDMPSNVIFRILAGIFICAFPVWNMASNFKENKFVVKVTNVLPYVFCPFIILEIYSVGVRVISYGLTTFRYVCVMFIIFQIIALFFTFIRKKELLSYLILATCILVLILFISPLNYDKVSSISQKHILTTYYKEDTDFSTLSKDDKQRVIGAYDYIHDSVQYTEDTPSYIKKDKIEQLRYEINYSTEYSDDGERTRSHNYKYNYADIILDIDARNYSRIAFVKLEEFNDDTSNLTLSNSNNLIINVNLENYINEFKNLSNYEFQRKLEENNIVEIDNERELYISSMNINYDSSNNKIENLGIQGYVLYK